MPLRTFNTLSHLMIVMRHSQVAPRAPEIAGFGLPDSSRIVSILDESGRPNEGLGPPTVWVIQSRS